MSHDYGCTNIVGYNKDCPNNEYDTCNADRSKADPSSCHISPNNPWNESIPLYLDHKIIE